MESEADLDAAINALLPLAASPEFYGIMVDVDAVGPLLTLLTHENTDIVTDTIQLLQELTDEDVVPEDGEEASAGMQRFLQSLIDNGLLDLLAQNVDRLKQETSTEDARGIFGVLSILENVLSFNPLVAEQIVSNTTLLHWMLQKLGQKAFDANKQYVSELVAILMKSGSMEAVTKVHTAFLSADGMEVLLKCLAAFKRKDPKDVDEQEMMENAFDALCSLLSNSPDAKEAFVQAEGVELMILMLKEKQLSRILALKTLAFAMSGLSKVGNMSVADRFIEGMGLKHVFASFMKKYSKKLKKEYPKSFKDAQEDEHCLTILSSLFRHVSESGPEFRLQRLLQRFNDEELHQLVHMHSEYYDRLKRAEKQMAGDEEDEDERYMNRLDQGLFTLQMVDLVLGDVLVGCGAELVPETAKKALAVMTEKERSLDEVAAILREYVDNVGDVEEDRGLSDRERLRVVQMVDGLEAMSMQ